MVVSDPYRTTSHWSQGHQIPIKSLQGVLRVDQVAIRAYEQHMQKDQDSQATLRSTKALFSSTTLHKANFSPKGHASIKQAFISM